MHDRQQRKWEVISRSDEVTKSTVGFTGDTFYTFFPVAAPHKAQSAWPAVGSLCDVLFYVTRGKMGGKLFYLFQFICF